MCNGVNHKEPGEMGGSQGGFLHFECSRKALESCFEF